MDAFYYTPFPVLGLRKKPFLARQEGALSYIQKTSNSVERLVDDRNLSGSFIQRNLQIFPQTTFRFCNNLDQLVFNQIKWGILPDGSFKTFHYSRENYRRGQKVLGVHDEGFNIEGIPYPVSLAMFELDRVIDLYCDLYLCGGRFRLWRIYCIDLDGEEV